MKQIEALEVFNLIERSLTPTDGPRLLHDQVAAVLFSAGRVQDVDTGMEVAEGLLSDLQQLIIQHRALAERDGLNWAFELCGTEDEYLRGSSFADASLSNSEQEVRANRSHVTKIKSALVQLSPVKFELACTAILRQMGCVEPYTSPRRDDGGIDFYGRLELKGRLDNALPYGGIDGRVGLWLIGQAKHYPTHPIQTAHLRELVGSVELARTGGAIHSWTGLTLRPFDPVVQLIFTTGHFSSGSKRLLDRSGIISMNGDQLATFMADCGMGIDALRQFDSAKLRSDLQIND